MNRVKIAQRLLQLARKVMAYPYNVPPELAGQERKFNQAMAKIYDGIDDYQDVMEVFARYRENKKVQEIGKRGINTARQRKESWNAIADDWHVMTYQFPEDD
jgi:hypothetical protein